MSDRVSDLRVGIERLVARLVINEARGQRTTILAAPHFIQDSAAQPGLENVKLGFRHSPFQSEQKPVIKIRRIVDAILIEDQCIGQRADLQQSVPVRVVPRQARDLQSHDDARAAHAYRSDQVLKTFAPGRRAPRPGHARRIDASCSPRSR